MFAILVPVLLGLAAVPSGQAGVAADATATIAAANAEWVRSMKTGDVRAIAAPYADDAIFVTQTGSVVKGRDAVAQLMRERIAQAGKARDVALVQDGVTLQGTLIYEWGHATMEFARPGGAPTRTGGRYLTVWQKDTTGRWEIIRNLSLPD